MSASMRMLGDLTFAGPLITVYSWVVMDSDVTTLDPDALAVEAPQTDSTVLASRVGISATATNGSEPGKTSLYNASLELAWGLLVTPFVPQGNVFSLPNAADVPAAIGNDDEDWILLERRIAAGCIADTSTLIPIWDFGGADMQTLVSKGKRKLEDNKGVLMVMSAYLDGVNTDPGVFLAMAMTARVLIANGK